MSLVKIRKFMKFKESEEYSELLLKGLPEGPARDAAASVCSSRPDLRHAEQEA